MRKEEQQKKSRHLKALPQQLPDRIGIGGGPVPDSEGIIDLRDLTRQGRHPLHGPGPLSSGNRRKAK